MDLEGLRAEVAALGEAQWAPHFNTREYVGDWSGAALRSVGGDPLRLYPDLAQHKPYQDTPLLARCPAVVALLELLACSTTAVRFLRLGAGAKILEHRDDIGWEQGEARLHIPVVTNPGVRFIVGGEVVPMSAGECWYADLTQPHRVDNDGIGGRVHLVVDCQVNPALTELFVRSAQTQLGVLRAPSPSATSPAR
ncbi:MAG: Aspartyl/asparaginyl beta-hydroxylase [Frankiales bacterium]|nr:Aspartyl/asparaginyl beta-hydroxylase [Frankiales bacterium]